MKRFEKFLVPALLTGLVVAAASWWRTRGQVRTLRCSLDESSRRLAAVSTDKDNEIAKLREQALELSLRIRGNEHDWASSEDEVLSLRIATDSDQYADGELVWLVAELRNDSDRPVRVMKLFFGFGGGSAGIEITGPDGKLKYVGPWKEFMLGESSYEKIVPGQVIRARVELFKYYPSLNSSGTYEISYRYHSVTAPHLTLKDVWSGSVASNKVTVDRR